MIKPKPLKKGDTVGIIAPSSAILQSNIPKVENYIKDMGLKPVFFPSCFERHGHLSGKDDIRAKDVNDAFKNPDIKGIFCLRGGYGTPRLLNMLDYESIKKNPKIFLGYSDITGLHIVLNTICNMVTYHGPTAFAEALFDKKDSYSSSIIEHLLFSDEPLGQYIPPSEEELEIIVEGTCSGEIVGGNLSLLTAALGSKYEIDTKGKIIFIEEVNELNYIIDRMLTSLDLAGKFEDCNGIILGTWNGCRPEHGQQGKIDLPLSDVFKEIMGKYNKVLINNFRAGHVYPQFTIPLGTTVEVDTSKKSIIFK